MPDGSIFTVKNRNKTGATLDLLNAILPVLGSADAEVRADAAARFTDLLTLLDLSWEGLAYLIVRHASPSDRRGARTANAAGRAVLG
jgi:hypothetical protein